jgi:hypothetical protein
MGKTSNNSRFNIPGKIAWVTMEAPGFLTMLYVMSTLPAKLGIQEGGLPWENWAMGGLFVSFPILIRWENGGSLGGNAPLATVLPQGLGSLRSRISGCEVSRYTWAKAGEFRVRAQRAAGFGTGPIK